jgi:hypothetical protein
VIWNISDIGSKSIEISRCFMKLFNSMIPDIPCFGDFNGISTQGVIIVARDQQKIRQYGFFYFIEAKASLV